MTVSCCTTTGFGPGFVRGSSFLYGMARNNNEKLWTHQLLISFLCCTLPRSCQGHLPHGIQSVRSSCAEIESFVSLALLYTRPITVPHRAQDSSFPCRLQLPFQVHPGSNIFSTKHYKTTPHRRETTSPNTTPPINSNAAVPLMRSLWYSGRRRGSLKNIEMEIAS